MTESYVVPFYILGFLIRLGPLHGYQLKARIESEASDFAQIKLPNIYYHLGTMKRKGWVESSTEREGNRPEREVFSITGAGSAEFGRLLERSLEAPVLWDFPIDGAIFFSKGISPQALAEGLADRANRIKASLARIAAHRREALGEIPESFRDMAGLIFAHHEIHYRAELDWILEAIETVRTQ
jgi:DNA-binding PadR family transcriptional regulator